MKFDDYVYDNKNLMRSQLSRGRYVDIPSPLAAALRFLIVNIWISLLLGGESMAD